MAEGQGLSSQIGFDLLLNILTHFFIDKARRAASQPSPSSDKTETGTTDGEKKEHRTSSLFTKKDEEVLLNELLKHMSDYLADAEAAGKMADTEADNLLQVWSYFSEYSTKTLQRPAILVNLRKMIYAEEDAEERRRIISSLFFLLPKQVSFEKDDQGNNMPEIDDVTKQRFDLVVKLIDSTNVGEFAQLQIDIAKKVKAFTEKIDEWWKKLMGPDWPTKEVFERWAAYNARLLKRADTIKDHRAGIGTDENGNPINVTPLGEELATPIVDFLIGPETRKSRELRLSKPVRKTAESWWAQNWWWIILLILLTLFCVYTIISNPVTYS